MLRRVALVRTDVSEELCAAFIRLTRIGELGTILAVTSNRPTLQRHGITSQKTQFFIVTAVKTSNLKQRNISVMGNFQSLEQTGFYKDLVLETSFNN
jgi:hypothetical protein